MLAAPSPHALDTTCHQCLAPLAPRLPGAAAAAAQLPMCSPGCAAEAQRTWAEAAGACDFGPLQQACAESGSKFPLMLARLACLHIQAELRGGRGADAAAANGDEDAPPAGDPLTQLSRLCYANVPQPPQPWVELHSLLLHGLRPLCSSGGGDGWLGQRCGAEWLERHFSLDWFCGALARLHINSFRSVGRGGCGFARHGGRRRCLPSRLGSTRACSPACIALRAFSPLPLASHRTHPHTGWTRCLR